MLQIQLQKLEIKRIEKDRLAVREKGDIETRFRREKFELERIAMREYHELELELEKRAVRVKTEMEEDRIQLEQTRLTSIKQDEDNRLAAETELAKIKLEIARFEAISYNPNQNFPVL